MTPEPPERRPLSKAVNPGSISPPVPGPEGTGQIPQASGDRSLQLMMQRLSTKLSQDELVAQVTDELRQVLQVDRVALYYFYRQWKGQVTFESLSDQSLSIVGMTGADECFNQDYAQMYLEGRIRAIPDVALADIHDCHREFLDSIQVKANLVVPVLPEPGHLWGFLSVHHCQSPHPWSNADIAVVQAGAERLALSPTIRRDR
ncbi:MAG: GAF domain-containing protein [Synechococcales cyanobacterium RU_4_20]|nr:GAF domain-containing protein [Synechococcales cyanobacterium RU_4_20]NJR69552.1 GAF domain-containing protein [Synechococcales cyanobacterium CRU_2_2]